MGLAWGSSRVAACLAGLCTSLVAASLVVNGCSLNPQPSPPARDSGAPTGGTNASQTTGTPTTPTTGGVNGDIDLDGDGVSDGVGVDSNGDGVIDGIDTDGDGVIDTNFEGEDPDVGAGDMSGTTAGAVPSPSEGGSAGAAGAPATGDSETIP